MTSSAPPNPAASSSTGGKKKNKKKKSQKPKSLVVPATDPAVPTSSTPTDNSAQPSPLPSPSPSPLPSPLPSPSTLPSPRDEASQQGPNSNLISNSNGITLENNQDTLREPETLVNDAQKTISAPVPNGHASPASDRPSNSMVDTSGEDKDASAALEAMTTEREAFKAEVEELRKQIESIQTSHESDLQLVKQDLEESESAREEAEAQYEDLQERVSQIKSTVAERLRRDKEQLDGAKTQIDELETANDELGLANKTLNEEAASLKEDLDDAERELGSLRSRSNLSQTNWHRERDDFVRANVQLKEELASATNAMGEWEVIAMEERARRENLGDKMAELEEQVSTLRDTLDKAIEERDTHAMAVDGLQRALQEIQDARRLELREMVESTETQMAEMRKMVADAETKADEAASERETLVAEVERAAPFEKEVKEKNLLIGKLRHEAIVLNDHLTRALKYLKKMQPENQVDRQIISNYFIQFLSLDRADQKRFQILQIIAGYLNWTDDEKAKVGLMRGAGGGSGSGSGGGGGGSGGSSSGTLGGGSSLRLPQNPFHRTPSTPSLNTEFFTDTPTSAKESLSDLWAGFLERGAEEAVGEGSRKDSVSTSGGGVAPMDRK